MAPQPRLSAGGDGAGSRGRGGQRSPPSLGVVHVEGVDAVAAQLGHHVLEELEPLELVLDDGVLRPARAKRGDHRPD